MGLIENILGRVFGDGRNVVAETAEVFRVNADKADQRMVEVSEATLQQFASEFAHPRKGLFDQFVDGLNRLPRPMLALGTIGLFICAMMEPAWFSERMIGVALIPEPMWWLMGAIVSFYFGARHQVKGQDFQKSVARTIALGKAIEQVQPPRPQAKPQTVETSPVRPFDPTDPQANAALEDWRASRD